MPIIPPPIPVKVERVDTRTIRATLSQSHVEWVVAKHVAGAQGIRVEDREISYRVDGISEAHEVEVTIVQDVSMTPVASPG